MKGASRPLTSSWPSSAVDAGQDLQQRALAGAVAADYAEELALRDVEVDVAQGVLHLDRLPPAPQVEEVALERVAAQVRQQEVLGDVAHLDHGIGHQASSANDGDAAEEDHGGDAQHDVMPIGTARIQACRELRHRLGLVGHPVRSARPE